MCAASSLFADNAMTGRDIRRRLHFYLALRNFHSAGNDYGISELVIDWLNVVVAIAVMKDTDNRRMSTPYNLHDPAFSATVSTSGTKLNQDLIGVHRSVHIARRNVDIAFDFVAYRGVIGPNESIPVAMNGELAGNQVVFGCSLG